MHDITAVKLEEFTQPTKLFNQPREVDPTELTDNETKTDGNYQDNGATLLHGNKPSSLYSPLTDASVASEPPPLCPCVNADNADRLASMANHPEVRLK